MNVKNLSPREEKNGGKKDASKGSGKEDRTANF